MEAFLIFVLKSAVTAGILFVYYRLFLKDRKMNRYNRFYLLTSVVLSLVIPLLHLQWYSVAPAERDVAFKVLQVLNSESGDEVTTKGTSSLFTIENIFIALYTLAGVILMGMLAAKIRWIYRLKAKGIVAHEQGFDLIKTKDNKAPFSFMNNLFWREDIDMQTEGGLQILKHELTHIQQKHTLDKLFMQVVASALWLNPFYWVILRELSNIHEFMADEAAVEQENTKAFALMILQSHYSRTMINIIQPFFYSPIKRRLNMLSRSNKTSYAKLRRLMLLPVLCVPVLLFSFKVNNVSASKAKKKALVIVDAGHGGSDAGCSGVNGLKEKNLTLALTEKLVALSDQYNLEVASTRKKDNNMALENRVDISNSVPADLFISIHVNKHADGKKAPDYLVYVSDKNNQFRESRVFASAMISSLQGAGIKPELSQKPLGVLTDNRAPAILIECGDIDNAKQMALLTNEAKQEQFCRNILSGVVRYVNSK